ncbi:leucine-rich repeat domain-containing protein [Kaistella sp. G5-32]|uniref:Leucine-rich repeat domain-containing protein n=1 Tax=Kaistella gelatinilytica TaxID=2787636 RepID=A0ABS0FB31_9FLAO|nr:leucine-rich repeat domain-containing protein [Kaistella gelatinilytica]MBF8456904.1 leucine-rich repeat domain-containing protein [Kaistella gelatinilytica]
MYKKLLLLFAVLSFSIASAFTVNGVNYNITSATTVEVGNNAGYNGALILPSTVSDGGTTYAVTSIVSSAFNSCLNLTSVVIPNSITAIGSYTFYSCIALTAVTIPNSVLSIGDNAFANCSILPSVILPNALTSIGAFAFAYCPLLS